MFLRRLKNQHDVYTAYFFLSFEFVKNYFKSSLAPPASAVLKKQLNLMLDTFNSNSMLLKTIRSFFITGKSTIVLLIFAHVCLNTYAFHIFSMFCNSFFFFLFLF
jgi:hypothetical protein